MFVVLASQFDRPAAALVDRWASAGARLMTPRDLSRAGWRDQSGGQPGAPADTTGQAVIDGEVVPTAALRGVLVRLPIVIPQELGHVVEGDREYVASEMTAFLVSWLSRLACPVLNRPTPLCLTGPAWRAEKWAQVAAGLGIPVHRKHAPDTAVRRVVIVGKRCLGDHDRQSARAAQQLARAAGVELLQVDFVGRALAGTSLYPAIDSADVAGAVLNHLQRGAA